MTATAIGMDRLGGLVAVSRAGLPCLIALATTGVAARALGRAWPELLDKDGARAAGIPRGPPASWSRSWRSRIRSTTTPTWTPTPVTWRRRAPIRACSSIPPTTRRARARGPARSAAGGWPFPTPPPSTSWPGRSPSCWGKSSPSSASRRPPLGLSMILVHALARALGFGPSAALLAQALFALLPVTASRLVLALYPTLLGSGARAAADRVPGADDPREWRPSGEAAGPAPRPVPGGVHRLAAERRGAGGGLARRWRRRRATAAARCGSSACTSWPRPRS